ncbi:IPPc domain-containing protein [Aphelenchoides bicaudatus]|nr:IPPc domain-containing protein [Aphelenchoides bicaudatus]
MATLNIVFVLLALFVWTEARVATSLHRSFSAHSQNKEGDEGTTIKILVTTFNADSTNTPAPFITEMYKIVDESNPPDLIVLGLQEMVDINNPPKALLDVKSKKAMWQRALATLNNYEEVMASGMLGLFLTVLKRKQKSSKQAAFRVANPNKHKVKTGIMNQFGNKGGIGMSLTLNGLKVAFINSHLAAHEQNAEERIQDFVRISSEMKFANKEAVTLNDHDAIIWMGDTNSRLSEVTRESAITEINADRHAKLWEDHDQLKKSQTSKRAFVDYHELPITFKPTFKYDKNTDVFDTSEKQRTPAWCDRILHKEKETGVVTQLTYYSLPDIKFSDHRPVQSMFQVKLKSAECDNSKPCEVAGSSKTV